jgi:hypothetical protein
MDESHGEKIARIDENVKALMTSLPMIQKLQIESELNKREHNIALGLIALTATPIISWFCKKLGIPIF